jgi:hypothetical protein
VPLDAEFSKHSQKIDIVAGTSIGGLNATIIASTSSIVHMIFTVTTLSHTDVLVI